MSEFVEHIREDGTVEYISATYDQDIAAAQAAPVNDPLPDELIAAAALVQYQSDRRHNYPPIEDFADAWVKNDEDALEAYRQACLAVKAQFPKPE